MLTLALVIAALVGHPVPVLCEPLPGGIYGMTWWGTTMAGTASPTSIGLAPTICGFWEKATPQIHTFEDQANDMNAGVALLVAVHEAEHYRYGDTNEAMTECRALRDFGQALNLVMPARSALKLQPLAVREALWQGAYAEDGALPAIYHGAAC